MTLYVWPWRLLVPKTRRVWIAAPARTGPVSLDGTQQTVTTARGGIVRASLMDISLRTPDHQRAARAWARALRSGVTECIVPLPSLYTAPRPVVGGRPMRPGTPAPTDDYFGEAASLGSAMMVATAATAALNAAELVITVTRGSRLRGGEAMGIDHGGDVGRRYYDVERVVSVGGGGLNVFTVKIAPLLRAAITGPHTIDFDVPCCTMKLDPAKADDLDPDLDHGKRGTVSAHFVESFDY